MNARLAAALVVALAACGDGAASPIDGVGYPDASGPLARVTVTDWLGAPAERAPVAVESPRGLVELFLTDAAGEASFRVVPGSRVWVVRLPSGIEQRPIRIDVVEAVDPGDVIGIGAPAPFQVGGHVSLLFTPIDKGNHFYFLPSQLSGCFVRQDGSLDQPLDLDVYGRCAVEPRETVIEALDDSTFLPVGYLRVPHLIPDDQPQVLDGSFEPGIDYELAIAGVSPEAPWVDAFLYSPVAWNYLSGFGITKDGAATVAMTGPTLPTPLGVRLYWQHGISRHTVYQPLATLPIRAELAVELLPAMTDLSFDRERLAVEWAADPGMLAPALVIGRLSTATTAWTIYAPGNHTAVVIHDPPAELGITTEDLAGLVGIDVTLVHADGADLKALLSDADRYLEDPFTTGELPATRVTLSEAFTQQ